MAPFVAGTVLSLVLAWLTYNAFCLWANYLKARCIGVPIIVSPITPDNPLWIALQVSFASIIRLYPFASSSLTRYIRLGWEFHDRFNTHQRLGDAWLLVTPARNWLFVANPEAVTNILDRGRDFIRPAWMLESLTVFGPNLAIAEGQDWQRQRKLTVTPFNENTNPLVWQEATRQASQAIKEWRSLPFDQGSTNVTDDARTMALNILAFAAFQQPYAFHATEKKQDSHHQQSQMTYRDSVATILENVLIVLVIPQSFFSLSFLPQSWQRVGHAISYFHRHMSDQIHHEQDLISNGKPGSNSLVSNLVRAGQEENTKGTASIKRLTEAEILGNIFLFNFAGHDTTAISLGYALFLLVAHPEVQDWIHEEIAHYTHTEKPSHSLEMDYVTLFPKLQRCLAVLLETLRLYNPLPGVPKYTGSKPTVLSVEGKEYTLPPDTLVVPHLQASHTHPRHWSSDSLTWRPQRWIQQRPTTATTEHPTTTKTHQIDNEVITNPPKGVFFAWSEGLRNCPGKKFAQVEFVAVIATLFRTLKGEPVPKPGESMDQARRRVLDTVHDSNVELLLKMNNPRAVAVRWKDRD